MVKLFNPLTALSAAVVSAAVVSMATPVKAFSPVTYGYNCTSNNSATDCGIAEQQFSTTVSQVAGALDLVKFTFTNSGSSNVTMTSIFFEDLIPKTLAAFDSFDFSGLDPAKKGQVQYSMTTGSTNVPSLQSFQVSFYADPNTPQPIDNGIGPGESLSIIFKVTSNYVGTALDPDLAIRSVLADLQLGSLRTAVKAQDFASGGSETLVNEQVPEPLTIFGSAVALAGGAALKRRASSKTRKEKTAVV